MQDPHWVISQLYRLAMTLKNILNSLEKHMRINATYKVILWLFLTFINTTWAEQSERITANITNDANNAQNLVVYKSPTCGCCSKWIEHVEQSGFAVQFDHPNDLDGLKDIYKIPNNTRSCHTAISEEGYVFEGHIPARYIHQFLQNPPQGARGLAVPAMPLGSPGMEMGNRFMPYEILLLRKDGKTEVYAVIESKEQQ